MPRKLTSGQVTIESDGGSLLTSGVCGNPPDQESQNDNSYPLSNVWSFIRGKVWGLVQNTFKKGEGLIVIMIDKVQIITHYANTLSKEN